MTVLVVSLTLIAATAAFLATKRTDHVRVEALTVTRSDLNPHISQAALNYVRHRQNVVSDDHGVTVTADEASAALRRLYHEPRVLGLVHPRRNVVIVGVSDDVNVDGTHYSVYTLVTLLNRGSGYEAIDALTACADRDGGMWIGIRVPDHTVVIALNVPNGAVAPFGSQVRATSAARAIRAWTDPLVTSEEPVVNWLGNRTTCPADAA